MADEARLHELLDLVEQARAEGDSDTEQKAIQAYRKEAGGTSTPPEPHMQPQSTSMPSLTNMAKGVGATVRTLGEGAYRGVVEGPGQLMSAVAQAPFDIYDATKVGKPFEAQTPTANILPNYNQAVQAQHQDVAQEFTDRYGAPPNKGGLLAGEMAGSFVLGGPKTPPTEAGTKILAAMGRGIASGAKAGAIGGATAFQEGADDVITKGMWTAGGGILGASIGVFPAVGAGLQTAFRKYLTGKTVGDTAGSVKELQGFIPGMEGNLNAGQETGNAGVQKFLNRSAGTYAQEQLLKQTSQLQAHLSALDSMYGKLRPAELVVKEGQEALRKEVDHMVKARARIWQGDLAAMRTKVTADTFSQTGLKGTDQVAIALPGLEDGFKAITQDFVNSGGDALTPGFQKILDEYRTFNGHLSFDSLEHLLRITSGNSGSILRGTSNPDAQRAAGKQLKRVVFDAIDQMDDQSEIGAMLKQMRAGYRVRSQAITDFNNGAVAKILNVKKGELVSDPEGAVDKILDLDPEQLVKVTPVLKNMAPEALSGLRSANIRKAYQEAIVDNPKTGTPGWDLDAFLKATVRNGKLRASGLYTEGEQEVLTRNMVALRPLLTKTAQGADTPSTQSAVMAGVSLAPAFVARTLFQLTGQGSIDRVLFDPASYAKFKAVNTLFQSQKWDQAAYLLSRMSAEAAKAATATDE